MKLQSFLESSGFHVTVASDGKDALEKIAKKKPRILITSIMMPQMDGYELCLEIKSEEHLKDVSVILLTSLSDPNDVLRGLECGADSYSVKPFEGSALMARINHILEEAENQKKTQRGDANLVTFRGHQYSILSGRRQILHFLLSTYETALRNNTELETARDSLRVLNEQLEKRVAERTAELKAEVVERRQAEESSRESEHRYRTLFDSASDGIFIINLEATRVIEANRAACASLGYTRDELLQLSIDDIEAPRYARLRSERLESLRSLGYFVFETVHIAKSGAEIPVELSSRIIEYGGRQAVLVIARDITDRKKAEEERLKNFEHTKRIMEQTIGALASALEKRDPYTAGHQRRVAELSCAIAGEMGLEEDTIEGLRMAAMIHDLGKIYVPAEILNKPGKLTELEFSIIKTHSEVGYDILKSIEFPWPVAEAVRQHHERLNGSGYPLGLRGDAIRIEAKILSVADVVEAMISHRPYRPGLGIDDAIQEIRGKKNTFYDSRVVDCCVRLFTEKDFKFS